MEHEPDEQEDSPKLGLQDMQERVAGMRLARLRSAARQLLARFRRTQGLEERLLLAVMLAELSKRAQADLVECVENELQKPSSVDVPASEHGGADELEHAAGEGDRDR